MRGKGGEARGAVGREAREEGSGEEPVRWMGGEVG